MASRLAASLVFLAASLPGLAVAEPSAADKETARSLMAKGREQTDKNDLKGALESFHAADTIMHVPSTGFAVARTQAQMNLLVEARDTALQVARLPSAANEPAPFAEARIKARALADELEPRIPAIVIDVKNVQPGTALTVTVDGAALPSATLSLPRKVNPGHHVIVARAASFEGKAEVDVKERETKTVDVELATLSSAPVSSGGGVSGAGDTSSEGRKSPALMYSGFGVGLAGVVVGTVTGLVSMSKSSTLKDRCPSDSCPPSVYDSRSFQDDLSSAKTMGTVSTVSFIVGGAGIAVGVVALLLPSSAPPRATTPAVNQNPLGQNGRSPRFTPFVGLSSAGLTGTF